MVSSELNVLERVGVLAAIVHRMDKGVGRIFLTKTAYLLQVVKGVPFGYSFRLYLYGPYSAEVVNDIGTATCWKVLHERYYSYGQGGGYEITPGEAVDTFLQMEPVRAIVEEYHDAIDWAVESLQNYSAAEMEAIATLVWVDREMNSRGITLSTEELLDMAQKIKPRFPRERFRQLAEKLIDEGVLSHVQPLHSV